MGSEMWFILTNRFNLLKVESKQFRIIQLKKIKVFSNLKICKFRKHNLIKTSNYPIRLAIILVDRMWAFKAYAIYICSLGSGNSVCSIFHYHTLFWLF